MSVAAVFWRTLRQDFETLQTYQFSLIWTSSPQTGLIGKTAGVSHWSWQRSPDESLRARLSAMALRGALALGYDCEDAWYDKLREAEFVRFKATGGLTQKRADGTFLDSEFGPIGNVVKESITLCYKLEADINRIEKMTSKHSVTAVVRSSKKGSKFQFQKRASWLADRLRERGWNKHDVARQRGPDHKTTQKVLDGLPVREDVLEKLATALSTKGAQVTVLDIPRD